MVTNKRNIVMKSCELLSLGTNTKRSSTCFARLEASGLRVSFYVLSEVLTRQTSDFLLALRAVLLDQVLVCSRSGSVGSGLVCSWSGSVGSGLGLLSERFCWIRVSLLMERFCWIRSWSALGAVLLDQG